MLTYPPAVQHAQPPASERPWLLLLLAFVWLWPGVFAHDLWAPMEPQLLTVIEQWRNGGHWALPMLFDQPYWAAAPVYVWLGAASQTVFSPWLLDAYEAVRLVNVGLMVIGFCCIGGAARQFLGHRFGRTAVLVLIGCPGLLMPAHLMSTIPLLFTGAAMCFYGLSLAKTRVIMASLMLGGGWVLLTLSGSLSLALALMLLSGGLWFSRHWRTRRYQLVLLIALLWAWPQMLLWPYALYQADAAVFYSWWQQQALMPFGGFGQIQFDFSLWYYLKNLLWFAFPAWPLAVWSANRVRLIDSDWGILGMAWLALLGFLLALSPLQFQDLLVILLPPLAVFGAAKLDALRRGAAAFLNWFGIMTFGLLALFLWLGFAAMNYGWPPKLAERAVYFSPYYQTDIDYFPMLVACILTPVWLWAITRQHVRGRQAVTNWAAGITLIWSLLLTLFLPWLDAAKSQRPVVQQMQKTFDADAVRRLQAGQECVSVEAGNHTARIAWQQYGWLTLDVDNPSCRYRLVRRSPQATTPAAGWQELWAGARPREKREWLALWQRLAAKPTEPAKTLQ